ncbi:ABC transporter permease [Piscibacillus salipiscarius]|nr:ABC transporter permease [Piscibacillus salipiscarius]
MKGLQLFRNKLSQHFRFYKRIKRLTIDWTVWIYVFIPFALMGASFYADLWLQIPGWPNYVTVDTLILIIILVILAGSHYAFLHHADLLYLWQKTNLIKSLNQF